MITLLLTLFICLFSYCPSVNTIEDHKENKVYNVAVLPTDNIYPNQYFLSSGDFQFWDMYYYLVGLYGDDMSYTVHHDYDFMADGIDSKYIKIRVNPNTDTGYQNWQYNTAYDLTGLRIYKTYLNGYFTEYGIYCYIDANFTKYIQYSWQVFYNLSTDSGSRLLEGETVVFTDYFTNIVEFQQWNYYFHIYEDDWNFFYPAFIKNHDNRIQDSYNTGYNDGYNVGIGTGYQQGYSTGFNDASNMDATASTIFTGVLDIALIPVNVFLSIFNFEVFGINISGIVSGLITVAVVIIIFRFLFGGSKND